MGLRARPLGPDWNPRSRRPGRAPVSSPSRDFGSMDEGVPVAPGTLHDSLAARWKIVHDDSRIETQLREVDDIKVRAIARGNHSAVVETVTPGLRQGLLVNQESNPQPP